MGEAVKQCIMHTLWLCLQDFLTSIAGRTHFFKKGMESQGSKQHFDHSTEGQ